jgi:hypothetical protein
MTGTASRVQRWLVVEQPGPWGHEALVESRLEHAVAQTVRSHARRAKVRVVLARRPGWTPSAVRRAYLARTGASHRWIERVDVHEDHDLVHLDLGALRSDAPPGVGVPGPPSVHLVCTNGKHDPCCADRGRPVVRALRDAGASDVWESSHVGGDRFAANLVSLPTGVYYGRVTPDVAPRLLRELDEGLLDLDYYRGRSCYPPLVQAAESFARRELGERRLDAVRIEQVATPDADHADVTVTGADQRLAVRVARQPGDPVALTCADHGRSRPWVYRLLSLAPLADA